MRALIGLILVAVSLLVLTQLPNTGAAAVDLADAEPPLLSPKPGRHAHTAA